MPVDRQPWWGRWDFEDRFEDYLPSIPEGECVAFLEGDPFEEMIPLIPLELPGQEGRV